MDATTAALLRSLGNQREHVLEIVEDLGDDDLRRSTLPSGWTPIGLVNHLALDVERFWFQAVVAGTAPDAGADGSAGSAWDIPDRLAGAEVLERYRHEITEADRIVEATPLDAAPAYWPERFGTWRLPDLRAILLHVITETACHAGHLDASRELLDGGQWLVL